MEKLKVKRRRKVKQKGKNKRLEMSKFYINIKNKKTHNGTGEMVDRSSVLGNHKYSISKYLSRKECVYKYAIDLKEIIKKELSPEIISELYRLFDMLLVHRTLNLVCWCSPKLCHASVIKQILLNRFYRGQWLIDGDIGINIMGRKI